MDEQLLLTNISDIATPLADHFDSANKAIIKLAEAIEELQCELQNAVDTIADLTQRLEAVEKMTPDDFGGKQITSGEGEPY